MDKQAFPEVVGQTGEQTSAAYLDGFRKAAEAYGVDPDALLKQAFPGGRLLKNVGQALGAAGARYDELLRGDNLRLLPYVAGKKTLELFGQAAKGLPEIGGRLSRRAKLESLKFTLKTLIGKGETADELRKVYATRLGTGLGATAALPASAALGMKIDEARGHKIG